MQEYQSNNTYLGNSLIKRAGAKEEWTLERIQEYQLCSEDPLYFIENYIKIITETGLTSIELFSYQREMILNFYNARYSINLLPRQSGKTTTVAAYLLWFALFNPEKTVAILGNKADTAKEILSRVQLALENVPFFLQCGVKSYNKSNIEFANNSRIIARASSSSSIRGISAQCLYIDEMGFLEKAEVFYQSVYPVITAGMRTKVIVTSTPNGVGNLFHRLWTGAVTSTNEFKPFRAYWWEKPGRDEKWKEETIRNTSQKQFSQEFECEFLGSGDTLIDANKLLTLSAQVPIHALENETVRVFKQPVKDHSYIMSVDVSRGRGQDYSTFNVIDISTTPFEQVCVFQDNSISPLIFPNKIYKYATLYNEAFVVVESNDNGVLVANSLFYDLEYDNQFTEMRGGRLDVGAEMTKSVKSIGCSNLKDLIEEHKLVLHDRNTIQEVCTFVARGRSFEAETGTHDDLVMNLVLFAWFSSNRHFRALTDIDIKKQLYEERIREMEEELLPFGVIDNGNSYASAIYENESFGGAVWQRI